MAITTAGSTSGGQRHRQQDPEGKGGGDKVDRRQADDAQERAQGDAARAPPQGQHQAAGQHGGKGKGRRPLPARRPQRGLRSGGAEDRDKACRDHRPACQEGQRHPQRQRRGAGQRQPRHHPPAHQRAADQPEARHLRQGDGGETGAARPGRIGAGRLVAVHRLVLAGDGGEGQRRQCRAQRPGERRDRGEGRAHGGPVERGQPPGQQHREARRDDQSRKGPPSGQTLTKRRQTPGSRPACAPCPTAGFHRPSADGPRRRARLPALAGGRCRSR